MNDIQAQYAANEITDSIYYKRIQQELRAKRDKEARLKLASQSSDYSAHETVQIDTKKKTLQQKNAFDSDYFRDQIALSSHELHQTLEKDIPKKTKYHQELFEKLKHNGNEIIRHLGHKINFSARKDEFKEMYMFNLQQAQSHNVLTSRFAKFKVGVVGHILSALGVPIKELKKLQRTAINDLFNENILEMEENLYSIELTEILHGKSRKSRQKIKLFSKLQAHLQIQMRNLGRIGFWSKQKLYEEKINQCKKIRQDFINEKQHLEYLLTFIDHQNKVSS